MFTKAAEIAFLALIFSLAFMQPSIESFGPAVTLTEPIFLVTAAIFALAFAARQALLHFDRIYILFSLYAIFLLLSAIFSADQRSSYFHFLGELYLIALAVLTINIVRTPDIMRKVVLVWLAASGVSALISTVAVVFFYLGVTNLITELAFHHFGTLPPGNYVRIQGTFLYPSMLCNYLTVSFLMLLAARRLGWITRMAFVFLSIVFSITAAFTLTPGLGGLLLAVAVWMWLAMREDGRPVASRLALAAGIIAAIAFQTISTFTPIPLETSPYSLQIAGYRIDPTPRLLVWTESLQTFFAHPFFGKGVGQNVVEVYFTPPSARMQMATDAHNTFLSVAAQSGIGALLSLIWICIAVVRRTLPLNIQADPLRTALGIAFISAFLVQGMVGSFDDARHLWMLIGLIVAYDKISRSKTASP